MRDLDNSELQARFVEALIEQSTKTDLNQRAKFLCVRCPYFGACPASAAKLCVETREPFILEDKTVMPAVTIGVRFVGVTSEGHTEYISAATAATPGAFPCLYAGGDRKSYSQQVSKCLPPYIHGRASNARDGYESIDTC